METIMGKVLAIMGPIMGKVLAIMVPIVAKTLPIMVSIMLTHYRAGGWAEKNLKSCLIL